MNEKCFEPGIIQAFLDGEAAPALSFEITNHAAKCDNCALFIAQAEDENAQVFAMLDRELNSLVPSQRLWNSISVAIAEEKKHHSFWDRIRSGILATFANPSIAVAASVFVMFAVFAAIWNIKAPGTDDTIVDKTSPAPVSRPSSTASEVAKGGSGDVEVAAPGSTGPITVGVTDHSPAKLKKMVTNADNRPLSTQKPRAEYAVDTHLPGEESYVRTIADLRENVDGRKDLIMSPSARVAFERDLAVVNDSIKKMKDVVRRNPKNQAARQVLYSSYQNKIDLLNSVVERGELMASMQ